MHFDSIELRDYFVARALEALITKSPFRDALDGSDDPEHAGAAIVEMRDQIARSAYSYADAMIAARTADLSEPVTVKYDYGRRNRCGAAEKYEGTRQIEAAIKGDCNGI